MNIHTLSHFRILRLVFIPLAIFSLTVSAGLGAVPDPTQSPLSLVRIELQAASDLERFLETGLPLYAQLQTDQGSSCLILPVTDEQQHLLTSLGFQLKVLDKNAGDPDSSYYLLYARSPEALQRSSQRATILEREGLAALVKAKSAQADRLSAPGVEIVQLKLHPLVISAPQQAAVPEQMDPDPLIQAMIDQVDQDTVYSYDAGLSGEFPVTIGGEPYTIATRYTYATEPISMTTRYTYEHFEALGLPVEFHTYPLGGTKRNVIAEQIGISQPERIFLITAHLDSTSEDPYKNAPGADDNASGSVGVLIAADILSQYAFDCTIRYALFTGEEQGLWGSYYYARDAASRGDNIEGVLNLDMIGYNTKLSPRVIELHTRPGDQSDLAIANLFVDVVDAYTLDLTPEIIQDGIPYSDHASFWDFDYPAILGIEDDNGDFNPYYHTTNDQVEKLDMAYFTNYVKAAVGTMAHMGCLLNEGALTGEVTDSETSNPIAGAQVVAQRSPVREYSTQTDPYGNYLLSLASSTYTVTAQAEGYASSLAPGVDVTSDLTTTLDIQLQPCTVLAPDFTFSPQDPLTGDPVTFSGVVDPSSTDPVTFDWDFGDGHTGSGQVVTHTYTVSDTYNVTMTASGCPASHPVTVTGTPGISVSIQSWDADIPYGETLTQTLEIGSSGEQTLTWNIAEVPEVPWLAASSTSGELAPQERQEITLTLHAPLELGTYTTTLQVGSNDPHQQEIEIPVTLHVACAAAAGLDFSFSPETPELGETVVFRGGVITGSLPVTYTWDFQDGSDPVILLNDATVEHTFPAVPQTYAVSLEAVNACSPALLAEHPVTVVPIRVFLPVLSAGAR